MDADVVVVGASAAGLAAAASAARAGARVVLLEARDEVGVPEHPAVVGFDMLWSSSFHPPPTTIRRRLSGVRFRSPLDPRHALEVDAPLSVLDRRALDRHLAAVAKKHGATIVTGVRGLRAMPDGALRSDEGEETRARVTIFADGTDSLARTYFEPVKRRDALTWGAAHHVRAPRTSDESFVAITAGAHAPGGRSQCLPLTDGVWAHWTFCRGSPEEARERAMRALRMEAIARGWSDDVIHAATFEGAAPDPVFTLPDRLVGDGVMVVGGAAGQGGLEVGVAAGELAGATAAWSAQRGDVSARSLRSFERACRARFGDGYKSLARIMDRLARLDDRGLDRLLRPWAGWRVPVRDLVGLAHPSLWRKGEAAAKFVARNPHAAPLATLLAARTFVPRLTR